VHHPWVAAFNEPEGGSAIEIFLPAAGNLTENSLSAKIIL
jgi:hypothetical protein